MRAVLMSIQPKWCEEIASKRKTMEIRTTYPKAFSYKSFSGTAFKPFKVYIYCTKNYYRKGDGCFRGKYCGKVIGEFVCNEITPFRYDDYIGFPTPAYDGDPSFHDCGAGYWITAGDLLRTGLTYEEFCSYGKKKTLYGWGVSNLVIYDEPKQLSDFELYNVRAVMEDGFPMPTHKIERAPQSWIYVKAA